MSLYGDNMPESIVKCHYEFAKNLHKVLSEKQETAIFSPLSIQIALLLMYLGAEGLTADELRKYLYLPNNEDVLLAYLQNSKLDIITGIFIEKTYTVESKYIKNLSKYFKSECRSVDFFNSSAKKSANAINDWFSSVTKNKIEVIIDNDAFLNPKLINLLLINAVYFKSDWLKPFKKSNTCVEKFYTTKNEFSKITMMHQISNFYYSENDLYKGLILPYKDKNFKMMILLPNEIDGLPGMEKTLYDCNVGEIINGMFKNRVEVVIPKFKLQQSVHLNDSLKELGMQKLFHKHSADFKGIAKERLFIDDVMHTSIVEIDENGNSGSTIKRFLKNAGHRATRRISKIYKFTADHPFIFYILIKNSVLFYGKFLPK